MRTSIIIISVLAFLLALSSVNAQEYTLNSVKTCDGMKCTTKLFGGQVFTQEGGEWKTLTELSQLKWESGGFNFSYNSQYWVLLEPFVVYNGVERTYLEIKQAYPNINMEAHISAGFSNHKFALNFSNIPQAMVDSTNYIGLRLIDSSGVTWDDVEKTSDRTVRIKGKVEINYGDLVDNHFTLNLVNKTWLLIGNISENYNPVTQSIYLDPTIVLQDADTETFDDAYVTQNNPNTNHGPTENLAAGYHTTEGIIASFLKYNISVFSPTDNIDSAMFGLYLYGSFFEGPSDDNLTVWYVDNDTWSEDTVTYNSWVTGAYQFVDYNESMNSNTGWVMFNITSVFQNAVAMSDQNFTLLLNATDYEGPGDYANFVAKENGTLFFLPFITVQSDTVINNNVEVQNQSYNIETIEGSTETFVLVMNSTNQSLSNMTASFIWNGTTYDYDSINNYVTATYNITTFYKTLTMPEVPNVTYNATVAFYWNYTVYYNDSSVLESSTSSKTQTVHKIQITSCGETFGGIAFNFSIFNEESRSAPLIANISTAFSSITHGYLTRNNSFSLTNKQYFEFCIIPNWTNYSVDAIIEYNATGYDVRYYYLEGAQADNETEDILLYMITDTLGNEVIVTVNNIYNSPEENVVLKVQRYFVSDNEYMQVAMGKTDFEGKAAVNLKPSNFYVFILERDGEVLRTFSPKYLLSSDSEITLNTEVGGLFEYYEYYDTLATTCSFNNQTSILRCTATDTTGLMREVFLKVNILKLNTSFEEVCSESGVGSSVTLTCDLSTQAANNETIAYSFRGSFCCSEPVVDTFITGILQLGLVGSVFGTFGLFLLILMLLPTVYAGRWSPAVSILFVIIIMISGSFMGLVSVGLMFPIMSLAIVGVIFIWKMKI